MKLTYFFLYCFICSGIFSQEAEIPEYYKYDKIISDSLMSILKSIQLTGDFDVGEDGVEQISFAVIMLNKDE
ncbi:MAG: hypothetical protein ACM339_02475, partial [Ignavibacteria bacterium]